MKWGVHFVNAACLTRYHGGAVSVPQSRLIEFREGSRDLRVRCYMHSDEFMPEGWYNGAERTLKLKRPFTRRDVDGRIGRQGSNKEKESTK